MSGHPNASNVLFQFQVLTNYQTGYGGFASSGWEGVAIDDVSVIHRPGTPQSERLQLSNFSSDTSGQYGDQRGWLDPSTSSINEWNWTTAFGMNPPQSTTNSFESSMTTPPGWSIDGTWPDGWELGEIGNTSGYGPGTFHSGERGAAINLTPNTPTMSTLISSLKNTRSPTTQPLASPSVLGFARNTTGTEEVSPFPMTVGSHGGGFRHNSTGFMTKSQR